MEWITILMQIFEVCIIPLLGVLTTYLVMYIKAKSKELIDKTDNDLADKYIAMLTETITSCVIATNQTYVEALKAQGKFDAEAQEIAFKKTYNAVMSILTKEAKDYLANIYGDLDAFITNKIEAEVKITKAFTITEK